MGGDGQGERMREGRKGGREEGERRGESGRVRGSEERDELYKRGGGGWKLRMVGKRNRKWGRREKERNGRR